MLNYDPKVLVLKKKKFCSSLQRRMMFLGQTYSCQMGGSTTDTLPKKFTPSPWEMMVGRRSFSFGMIPSHVLLPASSSRDQNWFPKWRSCFHSRKGHDLWVFLRGHDLKNLVVSWEVRVSSKLMFPLHRFMSTNPRAMQQQKKHICDRVDQLPLF